MVKAADFVRYVMIPYEEGWGYVYGTWGSLWTAEKQKSATRPQTVKYASKWIGKMVTDCSGLPRWALWQLGEKSLLHHAYYQYTDCCKNKGQLIDGARGDGKPIKRGTAVFLKGSAQRIHHVGTYVGNGDVVESKGTKYGVVMSKLSDWDYWGEYKVVDYSDEEGDKPTMRMLKKGTEGNDVLALQNRLNEIGYNCGKADGKFGSNTEAAVKKFQKDYGLIDDGIAGPNTLSKLGITFPDDEIDIPDGTPDTPACDDGTVAVDREDLVDLINHLEEMATVLRCLIAKGGDDR